MRLREKQIVIADVRDADDKDTHPTFGSVNDSGRNVDEATFADRMFFAVEHDAAFPFQDVIQLRRHLVVMLFRTVDVNRVDPSGDMLVLTTH